MRKTPSPCSDSVEKCLAAYEDCKWPSIVRTNTKSFPNLEICFWKWIKYPTTYHIWHTSLLYSRTEFISTNFRTLKSTLLNNRNFVDPWISRLKDKSSIDCSIKSISTKILALIYTPDRPFTILEHQNPAHDVSEKHKVYWWTDCKALKLRMGRSGNCPTKPGRCCC